MYSIFATDTSKLLGKYSVPEFDKKRLKGIAIKGKKS